MTFAIILYNPKDLPLDQKRLASNAQGVAELVTQAHTRVYEAALFSPQGGLTFEAGKNGLTPYQRDPRVRPVTGVMVLDCQDQDEAVQAARRLEYAVGTIIEIRPALRLLEG